MSAEVIMPTLKTTQQTPLQEGERSALVLRVALGDLQPSFVGEYGREAGAHARHCRRQELLAEDMTSM